jgi:hypothetical protein
MITPTDIPLLERKLADFKKYQLLNVEFTNKRGHRWANRLQSFARWLWENREIILQILGVVIMFAEDGTPIVVEEEKLDEKTLKEAKQNLAKRKPTKYTPHGEKVEDFTDEEALDEISKINQETRQYDLGLEDNPLLKPEKSNAKRKRVRRQEEAEVKTEGEVNDEVQPGEDRGEGTARHESDDV